MRVCCRKIRSKLKSKIKFTGRLNSGLPFRTKHICNEQTIPTIAAKRYNGLSTLTKECVFIAIGHPSWVRYTRMGSLQVVTTSGEMWTRDFKISRQLSCQDLVSIRELTRDLDTSAVLLTVSSRYHRLQTLCSQLTIEWYRTVKGHNLWKLSR